MADSMADYSKIQELLEIRRLYEELQERHQSELAEANSRVETLEAELRQRSTVDQGAEGRLQETTDELRKAQRALEVQRQEWEAKVERLQARIKELSTTAAASETPSRSGFFRR